MKHPAQCLSNDFADQLALSERRPAGVELFFGKEMVEFIDFICRAGIGISLPVSLRSFPQRAIHFL